MTTLYIQPDATGDSSDWIKASWTGWPPWGSAEFAQRLARMNMTPGDFQQTARYRMAVAYGLIEDGAWTGRRFPLERPGWVEGEPLARQLRLRSNALFSSIRDTLARAQGAAGRVLYARETAGMIRDHAAAGALRTGPGAHLTFAAAPPPPGGRLAPDQMDAWDRALPDASGPLVGALAALEAPAICIGPGDRAVYDPHNRRIVVPSLADDGGLRRAAAHWLGSVGWNGHAALSLRAARIVDGPLVPLGDGAVALPGPWVDAADARIHGLDLQAVERAVLEGHRFTAAQLAASYGAPPEGEPAPPQDVLPSIAARFAPGRDLDLALTWEVWPEQILGYLLTMAGAFVRWPGSE
jgi:hypothetical protein